MFRCRCRPRTRCRGCAVLAVRAGGEYAVLGLTQGGAFGAAAFGLQAGCVRVVRAGIRALDDRGRVHLADVRLKGGVAEQGPVAEVTVFEVVAVRVGLAAAVYRYPRAGAVRALVVHGAHVVVVAVHVGGLEDAVPGVRVA